MSDGRPPDVFIGGVLVSGPPLHRTVLLDHSSGLLYEIAFIDGNNSTDITALAVEWERAASLTASPCSFAQQSRKTARKVNRRSASVKLSAGSSSRGQSDSRGIANPWALQSSMPAALRAKMPPGYFWVMSITSQFL